MSSPPATSAAANTQSATSDPPARSIVDPGQFALVEARREPEVQAQVRGDDHRRQRRDEERTSRQRRRCVRARIQAGITISQ